MSPTGPWAERSTFSTLWSSRYEEHELQETAGKQVRWRAQVAKDRSDLLVSRLEKGKVQRIDGYQRRSVLHRGEAPRGREISYWLR